MSTKSRTKPTIAVLPFPIKGYSIGTALSGLEIDPLTTTVLLNCVPFDQNGRPCGAVRPGTVDAFPTDPHKDFTLVRAMAQTILALTGDMVQNRYSLLLVVDAAGDVWQSFSGNAFFKTPQDAGYVQLGNGVPSIAANGSSVFFADGGDPIEQFSGVLAPPFIGTTPLIVTHIGPLVASAGTVPLNVQILTFWRGRLLASGQAASPQILYASAVGDPTNWDFAADLETANPGAPWAINVAEAGQAGDTITALVPFSDDTLLVLLKRSIYRIDGDPTANGNVSFVSSEAGCFSKKAFCLDGNGTAYFVGLMGLHAYTLGTGLRNISQGRLGNYWQQIFGNDVELVFDRARNGVWLFDCIQAGSTAKVHLFYSIEFDGFFPIQFPLAIGPASAMWYEDLTSTNRGVLLGGINGHGTIRQMSTSGCGMVDDGGVAISSKVLLGPLQPAGDLYRAKAMDLQVVLGDNRLLNLLSTVSTLPDSDVNMDYQLQGGTDPASIVNQSTENVVQSGTFSSWGRQRPRNHRLSANAFGVLVSNSTVNKTWSMERCVLRANPAGRNR